MATQKRAQPRGGNPLDHLTPRDFMPSWPYGRLVVPAALRGVEEAALKQYLQSVADLRQWCEDVDNYKTRKGVSQQSLAARSSISAGTIGRIRNGESWPSWLTWTILRRVVPTKEQLDDLLAGETSPAAPGRPTVRGDGQPKRPPRPAP